MKKLFMIVMVAAVIMGFGTSAYAGFQTQVTLTSPAIVKTGCEKIGAVQYSVATGGVLTEGDWWYFDLPAGATICSAIDYFIVSAVAPGNGLDSVTNPTTFVGGDIADVDLRGATASIHTIVVTGTPDGPLSMSDLGAGLGVPLTFANGGVVLRVVAAAGSQRVWMYVYGIDNIGGVPGAGAGIRGSVTVPAQTAFEVDLVNGQPYRANILLNTDTTVATPTQWGDEAADTIDNLFAAKVPHIENTLCVNAELMSGSLMFVSFASLNDFLTFTGDSQIAHVASANPLALASCKGETTGNIAIGAQGACTFDYETALNYCPPPALFVGNRILLEGQTTFGDPGDSYDIVITSDTPGVYFSAGAVIGGFLPSATTECTGAGAPVVGVFNNKNETGTINVAYPGTTCSVPATNRVREIYTTGGNVTNIDTYDTLWIALPNMVYDTSVVGNGVASNISIKLNKYPCGQIFSEQTTIGTFVTTCPVGVGGTTLLFPFLPPMDGSIPGWWGGFAIVNGSTVPGTAVLTFTEEDGDTATLTTPSIAAAGLWSGGALTSLLTQVTPGAGNAGTFGDANVSVVAVCAFNLGGGFAFTGNGDEGTGYTAYVLGAAGWQ